MTVNNSANKVVAAGNGVITVFNFSFIGVEADDIAVIFTDATGHETTLTSSQYTLALNAAPPGQIWGIGGTVTYPLIGSPIALNTTLTIVRTVPLLQKVALGNQGNEFPSAVETALDLLEMQLQQVNELFQRAIVAPVVDPSAPLPLPPAAQRANLALVFDGSGNPIAGAIPGTGIISSAMQPVVNAATLAAGRTAFGLGTMATEGIGAGLQDDGSGNARVNTAITAVASNQSIHIANHLNVYAATGALTFTLDRGNTLFDGFTFIVFALTGAITVVPNAADNFYNQSSGASLIIPKGSVATFTTDGATNAVWYPDVRGASPSINVVKFTSGGTYTPTAGLLFARVQCQAGGGGGGGCTGTGGAVVSGGGGEGGGYSESFLTAATIGTSQTVTVGAGGTAGGTGGTGGDSDFGTLVIAKGGIGGGSGNSSTIASGGTGQPAGTGQITILGEAGAPGFLSSASATVFGPSGRGGSSILGQGGAAQIANGTSGTAGAAGRNFGGAGSGGTMNNNAASIGGGAGGAGIVIVTEYLASAA